MSEKVVLIGCSHMACLLKACLRKDPQGFAIGQTPIDPLFILCNDCSIQKNYAKPLQEIRRSAGMSVPTFEKNVTAKIAEVVKDAALVVSMVAGTVHNTMTLVEHERPFDFVLEEEPNLPLLSGREILPTRLFFGALEKRSAFWLHLLETVRVHHKGLFLHVESPPPVREDHIKAHPRAYAEMITRHGVAPASLRYKAWRLNTKLNQLVMAHLGGYILPAPPSSMDPDGFLLPQFTAKDPTHASIDYGALIYRQLEPIIAAVVSDEKRNIA